MNIVICAATSMYPVRLVAPWPNVDFLGRVEVSNNGTWGTICHNSFGLDDANVVCRMLGFNNARCSIYSARFGPGTGKVLDSLSGCCSIVSSCNDTLMPPPQSCFSFLLYFLSLLLFSFVLLLSSPFSFSTFFTLHSSLFILSPIFLPEPFFSISSFYSYSFHLLFPPPITSIISFFSSYSSFPTSFSSSSFLFLSFSTSPCASCF